MIDQALKKVWDILDRDNDYPIQLTQQLVRYKSLNPNFIAQPELSEEPQLQDFLEGTLRDLGLRTTRWEAVPRRPNLVAQVPGQGGGKGLIFNGHIDVVPPGDESAWKHDPWGGEVDDNRLYGRGAYDMKAGIATFVAATRAILEAGVQLKGDLSLHCVVDEESGSTAGTRDVVAKGFLADAVIVAEPTEGVIQAAEGGLSWVRVTLRGRTSHAGWRYAHIYPQPVDTPFSGGVNAIEKAVKFLNALRELEREWALSKRHPLMPPGITTINPGVILGGVGLGEDGRPMATSNPATIPDVCVIDLDFKYLPTETFEQVKDEFEAFVDAFAKTDPWLKENPPKLQWHLSNIDFPPFSTPPDHPLVLAIQQAQQMLGLESQIAGFAAVTDAAFYAGAGVTSLIFGGSGGAPHAEDEYVNVSSLLPTAKVYAGAILQWCGVA